MLLAFVFTCVVRLSWLRQADEGFYAFCWVQILNVCLLRVLGARCSHYTTFGWHSVFTDLHGFVATWLEFDVDAWSFKGESN